MIQLHTADSDFVRRRIMLRIITVAVVLMFGRLAVAQLPTAESERPRPDIAANSNNLLQIVGGLPNEVDSIVIASGKYNAAQDRIFDKSEKEYRLRGPLQID